LVQCHEPTITGPLFEPIPPFLVQMTVVHEPRLQLLKFATHLTPLFSKVPCFCALLLRELAMLGSSLCESRKAVLGPRACGGPSMELTAPHRESSRPLAQSTPTGPSLAPNTLPVWAVDPWFGIGFHCAQLPSIHGVFSYPISDGFARCVCLGPRTAVQANHPMPTEPKQS
jgi:hypothetical protein